MTAQQGRPPALLCKRYSSIDHVQDTVLMAKTRPPGTRDELIPQLTTRQQDERSNGEAQTSGDSTVIAPPDNRWQQEQIRLAIGAPLQRFSLVKDDCFTETRDITVDVDLFSIHKIL